MITEPAATELSQSTSVGEPLSPHWVEEPEQARKAARSDDTRAVWIVRKSNLATRVVRNMTWPVHKAGYLVWIGSPRPEVLPALEDRYVRVVFVEKTSALPKEELRAVLKSPYRRDRFLGGMVDRDAQIVTLLRGDLTPCVVPFSTFAASAAGVTPDWDRLKVTDYGNTVQFGNYESASDALLYECDGDFRRRLKKSRIESEQTLGASIRRLRKQRRLTRSDFPEINAKTLMRIEQGKTDPRAGTLAKIAERLGVSPDELAKY